MPPQITPEQARQALEERKRRRAEQSAPITPEQARWTLNQRLNKRLVQAPLEERQEVIGSKFDLIDADVRYLAKSKATEEGTQGFLEAKYGKGSVVPIDSNNYAVVREGKKPLLLESIKAPEKKRDKSALEKAGDVAFAVGTAGVGPAIAKLIKDPREAALDVVDILPEIEEGATAAGGAALGGALGVPVMGIGAIPGAIVGGAGGSALGRIKRQARSAMLPGEDFPSDSPLEEAKARVKDVGETVAYDAIGSALGGIGGKALRYGGRAIASRIPGTKTFQARKLRSLLGGSSEAAEEMAQRTAAGEPTLPSEVTQSRKAIAEEKKLRKVYPEMFEDLALQQDKRFAQETNKTLGTIAPTQDIDAVGKKVGFLKTSQVARFHQARRTAANASFGEARRLMGEASFLRAPSTQLEIDAVVRQGGKPTSRLKQLQKSLSKSMTVDEYQHSLELLGKATQGQVKLDSTLTKAGNAKLARQLFRTMQDDLGKVAKGQDLPGEAASALKDARDAYRVMSEGIDKLENDLLARTIKKMAPPRSALAKLTLEELSKPDTLVKTLTAPSTSAADAGKVVRLVDSISPATADEVRRASLDQLLNKARTKAGTPQAKAGVEYDVTQFAELVLGKAGQGRKINALLGKNSVQAEALRKYAERAQSLSARRIEALGVHPATGAIEQGINPVTAGAVGAGVGGMPGMIAGGAATGVLRKVAYRLSGAKGLTQAITDPKRAADLLYLMKQAEKPVKARNLKQIGRVAARLVDSLDSLEEPDLGVERDPAEIRRLTREPVDLVPLR